MEAPRVPDTARPGCPNLLLDTSAASRIMRREPDALRRLRSEDPGRVFLCTPVAAEIRFGLSRLEAGSRRRLLLVREFERLRTALRWKDWTEPASLAFGHWKRLLQQRGTPIEDMDLAIASIAITLPARLATGNMRHFSRIEDLDAQDWSGDGSA